MHTLWIGDDKGCWLVVTRASLDLPIRFYCRKMKNSSFYKNDTPSHPKISSNLDSFGILRGDVFDSQNFLDHQNVSNMSSKLLYGIIDLQQSHSECLKWLYSSYVAIQSPKVKFLCLLDSQWRSQNLPICWILLHSLTSSAPKKFSISQKHSY